MVATVSYVSVVLLFVFNIHYIQESLESRIDIDMIILMFNNHDTLPVMHYKVTTRTY